MYLGHHYSLSSQYTSFLAVSKAEQLRLEQEEKEMQERELRIARAQAEEERVRRRQERCERIGSMALDICCCVTTLGIGYGKTDCCLPLFLSFVCV